MSVLYIKNEKGEFVEVPALQGNVTQLLDYIYPIGSIYMSVNNVSPSDIFGGVWEQIQDRFLLASGNSYILGNQGGEATHILSINELPSHEHPYVTVSSIQFDLNNYNMASGFNVQNEGTGIAYTNAVGGNQAHNNMPPYLVVNIWKRTS